VHVTEPILAVSLRILIGDDREHARDRLSSCLPLGGHETDNARDGATAIEADVLVELLASLPASHARSQQHATSLRLTKSFGDPTFEEIESACKFFRARIKKYLISSRRSHRVPLAARAGRRRASFAGPGM
jgi:hypothetical protein